MDKNLSDSIYDFSDKVVLITGASSGIGRAVAETLGRHGASVVIGDVNSASAQTAAAIEQAGGRAVFIETNVTDAGQVERLVKSSIDHFGGLHGAFNNAGSLPPTTLLAETEEKIFDATIAVDLKGVFLSMKYEIAYMLEAGGRRHREYGLGRGPDRRCRHGTLCRREARRNRPDQSRGRGLCDERHPR